MDEVQKTAELSFEEALKILETIVEKISRDNLSLDELIVEYEDGLRYLSICRTELEKAEMKVQLLNERIKKYTNEGEQDG
jgi:exodeoxyribonuclease VII small subunit